MSLMYSENRFQYDAKNAIRPDGQGIINGNVVATANLGHLTAPGQKDLKTSAPLQCAIVIGIKYLDFLIAPTMYLEASDDANFNSPANIYNMVPKVGLNVIPVTREQLILLQKSAGFTNPIEYLRATINTNGGYIDAWAMFTLL